MKNTFLKIAVGLLLTASAVPLLAEPNRNGNICGSFYLAQTPAEQHLFPNLPATVTWNLVSSGGGNGGIVGIPPCAGPNGAQNIAVNWGEGTPVESIPNFVGTSTTLSHTFTTAGSREVTVSGQSTYATGELVDFSRTYFLFLGPSSQPQITAVQPLPTLSTTGMDWNARLYDNRTKILFLTDELGVDEIREADLPADGTVSAARPFPLPLPPGRPIHSFEITDDGNTVLLSIPSYDTFSSFIMVDRRTDPPTVRSVKVPTFFKGMRTANDDIQYSDDRWTLPWSVALSSDGSRLLVRSALTGGEQEYNILSCVPSPGNPYQFEVESNGVWPDEFERLTALDGTIRMFTLAAGGPYITSQAGPLPGAFFANVPFDDRLQYANPFFTAWLGENRYEPGALSADAKYFLFSSNKAPTEGEYDLFMATINPFPTSSSAIVGSTKPDAALDANKDGVIDAADVVTP